LASNTRSLSGVSPEGRGARHSYRHERDVTYHRSSMTSGRHASALFYMWGGLFVNAARKTYDRSSIPRLTLFLFHFRLILYSFHYSLLLTFLPQLLYFFYVFLLLPRLFLFRLNISFGSFSVDTYIPSFPSLLCSCLRLFLSFFLLFSHLSLIVTFILRQLRPTFKLQWSRTARHFCIDGILQMLSWIRPAFS